MVAITTSLASIELAAFGAAKLGLVEELEECFSQGAPLNAKDADGRTCLHYAAGYGFEQAVDLLLGREGIAVDAADKKGDTALHLAAAQGHPMCAFNLTKAHPSGCLQANSSGQSPLDIAVSCDRGEVLNAMLLACAGIKSAEALKAITALLQAGAVPDTWAPNGSSALMLAAAVDSVEAIHILLDNGATVELQDALGRTALMFATGSGAKSALQALLDAGALLAARDRRGKDILDYAPEGSDVRAMLQDRLRVLEAAAEEMQAALLASIAEETGAADRQEAKPKRKDAKKGKRSKRSADKQAAGGVEAAEDAEQPGGSGREDEADGHPSETESDTTAVAVQGESKEQPAEVHSAAAAKPRQPLPPESSSSGSRDEEWKVVSKAARKQQGKAQPPKQPAQPAGPAAGKGPAAGGARTAQPYKRCPSVTSLSDSTCSGESDQSMASAACSHASSVPHPGHQSAAARPAKPAQLPLSGGRERGSNAACTPPESRHPCMAAMSTITASPSAAQQQPHTWAAKVAATAKGMQEAKPGCGAMSRQDSEKLPRSSHDADAAGPRAAPACCEQQQQQAAACSRAELAAARAAADEAAAEKLALAAEVERLRAALVQSEVSRQQEVARLLQNAAAHETQVVEEAVQAERAAMAIRLLATFESLKAMAQNGATGGLNSSPGGLPAAVPGSSMRGAMASLLGLSAEEEPSSTRLGCMYNNSNVAPFAACTNGGSGEIDDATAGLLGSSLSMFSSHIPESGGRTAAAQPAFDSSSLFPGKHELKALKSNDTESFSLFNPLGGSSIWS